MRGNIAESITCSRNARRKHESLPRIRSTIERRETDLMAASARSSIAGSRAHARPSVSSRVRFIAHEFSAAAAARRRPSKFTSAPSLSGSSAPLTTLSRKFVNVHAGPIIRSSASPPFFLSLGSSRAIPRSRDRFSRVHLITPPPHSPSPAPRLADRVGAIPRAGVTSPRRAAATRERENDR